MAGSEVLRYHTKTTLVKETVGHHSHGVAMLVLMLRPEASSRLLHAALTHDLAEHITGDIPSPAKRKYGIGEQVNTYEEDLLRDAGLAMPLLTTEEERLLKLADVAHGALFCAREISMGNRRMREVFETYLSYAEQLGLAGAEKELFNLIKEQATR
jgi:5'-deoxynucleotidase YfbR-like HD superfamily hydrolase